MLDASIAFTNPEHIQALFGVQDRYLRQMREHLGISVTVRGDELRLRGSDEQLRRGIATFSELRAVIAAKGYLTDADVHAALGLKIAAPAIPHEGTVDLFEKARRVAARSPGQVEYIQAIRDNDLVFCLGPAGCGKTYLAVAMALNALRQEQVKKIVLVRPAVEAGERLGFLPGDMLAKVNPFLRPLLDALVDMLDYEQVKRYMERDVIEIVPLAFMRGRTLNNTFVILDEGQNTTVTQMKMFLTRMGVGSKIVVNGDASQSDLPVDVVSGLMDAVDRLMHVEGVTAIELTGRDIVRHRLVREIVKAYDDNPAAHLLRRKG